MRVKRERSRWEIIHDILAVTCEEEKARKTRIMQGAYLDFRNFKRYFEFVQKEGFIAKCITTPECYEPTQKGKELFRRLKEVDNMLTKEAPKIIIPLILFSGGILR